MTGYPNSICEDQQEIIDDLLAALEGIIDLVPTDCQDEARTAILKAKGE